MAPFIAALGAISLYLATAGPTFYWLDSSEFVAASWSLGIAHPPGHPLPSLLARLFTALPVGSIAFRVTLASIIAAAATAAAASVITQQLIARHGAPDRKALLPSLIAGLTAATSYALWFQAVRAEVYALNCAVLLWAVVCVLAWEAKRDQRYLLGAGLLIGLGLSNHHFLVLLALVGVAVPLIARARQLKFRRLWFGLTAAALLGTATFAYLPLRAAAAPRVNWGSPTTAERFGWVVSAKLFQRTVEKAPQRQTAADRALGALFALLKGLSPIGAMIALGGLYLLIRRRETRWAAGVLLTQIGANLLSPLLIGFDPFNPDAYGYLAVAVCLLAPAAGFAVWGLCAWLPRIGRAWVLIAAGATALPVGQALAHYQSCDLSNHWAAEENSHALLRQDPNAVLFSSYFGSIFGLWALQSTHDLRPDVAVVHRNFVRQPGYLASMIRRQPKLAGELKQFENDGKLSIDLLGRLATRRPVAVEYDLNLSSAIARHLQPNGLAQRFAASPSTAGDPADHTKRITRWQRNLGPLNESETRRAVVWTHYLLATFGCASNNSMLASVHLKQGLALEPRSRQLEELAKRCRSVLERADTPE